jgi:SAM-dependent methyltransferase
VSDKPTIEAVERELLSVYRAENPSNYQIDRDAAAFAAAEARLSGLFRDHLKFPPRMFRGATLLDAGAGTGERTVFYSRWGARCTLADINADALARARTIFDRFAPSDHQARFIESSLFGLSLSDTYDLVVCDGVLHHTADKERGFSHLAQYVGADGYFILGIGNRAGYFRANLQRLVLFHYGRTPEAIEALAPRFFPERLERAVRFGGRTRRAIIYDSYVNPKIDTPLVSDVLRWFHEAGLTLYSTWPALLPPFLADAPGKASLTDILSHPLVGAIPELFWLGHTRDDSDALADYWDAAGRLAAVMGPVVDAVGDVTPEFSLDVRAFEERLSRLDEVVEAVGSANGLLPDHVRFRQLFDEIRGMLELLRQDADADAMAGYLEGCRVLFGGTHGLGMSYFVGYRPVGP